MVGLTAGGGCGCMTRSHVLGRQEHSTRSARRLYDDTGARTKKKKKNLKKNLKKTPP